MLQDYEICSQFRIHKSRARNGLAAQMEEIEKCQAAYNGDTAKYEGRVTLYSNRGDKRQTTVSFNKIRPYVSGIVGYFAQNRSKAKFTARTSSPEEQEAYSEYCNGLHDYIRSHANADQIETAQDRDLIVGGIGIVETNLVYGDGYATRNPNGEVEMMVLDPLACGWDPNARMPNLIDSRFCYFLRTYDVEEAEELFGAEEGDFEDQGTERVGQEIAGTGSAMLSNIREIYDVADENNKIVRVYFYQWFEIEKYYRAANPLKQISDPMLLQIMAAQMKAIQENQEHPDDPFSFRADDEVISCDAETKRRITDAFDGIPIEWDAQNRRVYNYAILSGHKVFRKGRSISQSGFTMKFKTGDWNATKKIWQGIVSSMIDPQKYYNKALTELLFAIASAAKGGVIAEESAIADIQAFEASYARTDSVTTVSDGALTNGAIKPKREQYNPNGVDSLIGLAGGAIGEVSGIDPSFLGNTESKQETAMLHRQRIKQVVSVLACYADAITLYQRESARLMLDIMRVYLENNEGETFRITDEDTGDISYMPMQLSRLYDRYDVDIQEMPESPMERQERAVLLNNMADTMIQFDQEIAKVIYSVSMKYLPLDVADKAAIRKALVPDQGEINPAYVKQLEEQVNQLQSEMNKAQIGLIKSETAKNLSKLQETIADIRNTNMDTEKKRTEAQKNIVQASDIASRPAEYLPQPKQQGA